MRSRNILILILSCMACTIKVSAQQLPEKMASLFYSAVDSTLSKFIVFDLKDAMYWADIAHNAKCDSDTYMIDYLLAANKDLSKRDINEVGHEINIAMNHFRNRTDSIGLRALAMAAFTRAKYELIVGGDSALYYFNLSDETSAPFENCPLRLMNKLLKIDYYTANANFVGAAKEARNLRDNNKLSPEMTFLVQLRMYHIYTLLDVQGAAIKYGRQIEASKLYKESLTFETLYLFRKSQFLTRYHEFVRAEEITKRLLQTTELYGTQYEVWRAHLMYAHVLSSLNDNKGARLHLNYCKTHIDITNNNPSAREYVSLYIPYIEIRILLNEKRFAEAKHKLDNSGIKLENIKNINLSNLYCKFYNQIYRELGDYKSAIYWLKRGNAVHDSLTRVYVNQRIENFNAIYNDDTTILSQQTSIDDNESFITSMQIKSVFWGLIVLLLVLTIIVSHIIIQRRNSAAHTQREIEQRNNLRTEVAKQTEELRRQKDLISEQNNDIMLSQSYAKRIQRGILPKNDLLNIECIKDSLIFYKPADNISGDFYWFDIYENKIIICCADCAGHGIPGALMSVVGITLTSDIVSRYRDAQAHEILDHINSNLVKMIPNIKGRDGINFSIAIIDTQLHTIQLSAAWQNIIVVDDDQMTYVRGVRRRIGDFDTAGRDFEEHILHYHDGCRLYLYTDGLTSRIGSDNDTKLKISGLKKIIERTSEAPKGKRMQALKQIISEWRDDSKQTDDILLIGIEL